MICFVLFYFTTHALSRRHPTARASAAASERSEQSGQLQRSFGRATAPHPWPAGPPAGARRRQPLIAGLSI
jgi:hypothetical protein